MNAPTTPRRPSIAQRVHEAMHPADDGHDDAFDPGACRASGCPCRGSVDLGSSGRFLCAWHAWAPPDKQHTVTHGLRSHRWLIDFIGEVQALYRDGAKGDPWIARAREFWLEEPRMQPTATEARHWSLYLWRLREDLSHRIGLRADAPVPRVRQCEEEGFAARAVAVQGEEVAA
jgi:hypothetical protein